MTEIRDRTNYQVRDQNTLLTRLRLLFVRLVQGTDYYNCQTKHIARMELTVNFIMCTLYELRFNNRLNSGGITLYGALE